MIFTSMTVHGFRIEFQPASGLKTGEDTLYTFMVINSERDALPCTVLLPDYVRELVKAHTNREDFPSGDRFWQALCEEALTNYLCQHAEVPPQGVLRVAELPNYLRRFVDAVLERRRV